MVSCPFPRSPPFTSLPASSSSSSSATHLPTLSYTKFSYSQIHFVSAPQTRLFLSSALKSPRGFGTPPKKRKTKTSKPGKGGGRKDEDSEDEDEDEDNEEGEEGVIPEIVTNRMISRMGFSVGVPLFVGLCFFPFFYYLKVGLKIDVPTWVPFIVSFFFFGSALLGVSYGIVSSSWDPMREGSFLGWNEAQKNWPVFWQSLWGRAGKK